MKKLLILASTLVLFACGGGGGGGGGTTVTTGTPGGNVGGNPGDNAGGNPVDVGGGANNSGVAIYLPPVQPELRAQGLVAAPAVRNRARLVVTQEVTTTVSQPVYGTEPERDANGDIVYDDEDNIVYPIIRWDPVTVTTVVQTVNDSTLNDTDGSGAATIALPPTLGGNPYKLQLLTYRVNAGDSRKYLKEYAESNEFTIEAGQPIALTFPAWPDRALQPPSISATLQLSTNNAAPGEGNPIVSQKPYVVTVASKSDALRDQFFATSDDQDPGTQWFVTTGGDMYGVSPLTLTAPLRTSTAVPYQYTTLYVQSQFFINSSLLKPNELGLFTQWTFSPADVSATFAPLAAVAGL